MSQANIAEVSPNGLSVSMQDPKEKQNLSLEEQLAQQQQAQQNQQGNGEQNVNAPQEQGQQQLHEPENKTDTQSQGQQKQEQKQDEKKEPALETREEAQEALTHAKLNIEDFENEFAQTGGLSEQSYAILEKAGFKRDMVDRYIQASTIISENMISSIQGIVGGQEQYKVVTDWAMENLPASEIEAFNKIVTQSNNINLIRLAVENLNFKYKQTNGSKPQRSFHGQTSSSSGQPTRGFRSSAEMVEAMRDRRYGKDPAYTREVEERVYISKF